MRRVSFLNLILACSVFTIIFSCKSTHKLDAPKIKENKKLEEKEAGELKSLILENSFNTNTLSARASVNTDIGGSKTTFSINIRMRTDSIIWISISPLLGIEVARIIATRDSIKFLDRFNKQYSATDYKYINKMFDLNIEFDIMQGVITGNIFSYKKNKFNSVYIDDKYYILSTLSKSKLNRSLEEDDPSKAIVQDMWIDDLTYKIIKLSIEDKRVNKKLLTKYDDFNETDGGLFPFKSNTQIIASKNITINLEFTKVSLNQNLTYPFRIPASYDQIY
jgi:Domain of unknown function (DUF4292)